MRNLKKIILILVFYLPGKIIAQVDPHFSQFYAYPLWLNPGMTGVIGGDYRVSAIYRNQWSDVMTPFETQGISADVRTNKNLNIGVNFLNQSAGDAGYKYLNAYLSLAYSGISFGENKSQQITFGMQAGLLGRRFDPTKFQFGDQWNPITGYDPGANTADLISKTSSSVLDLGAGISYSDGSQNKSVNFFGGISAFHLTKPQDPFFNSAVKKNLPIRYTFHAGARININEIISITPNVLYLNQGTASEKMAGLTGELQVNENTGVIFGGNYRFQDAIAPFAGISYRNFILGLSYDVNTSELGKSVKGTNSFEISLTYKGVREGSSLKYLSCPKF